MSVTTAPKYNVLLAAAQLGNMTTIFDALYADTEAPAWIEFYSATIIEQGGPLATLIQFAMNWTEADMTTLFDTANAMVV